jgi:endoglycosylceramidase
MGVRRALLAAALTALVSLVVAATAVAAPTTPLGHAGRWVTDDKGRVVILHGVNMVFKREPFAPDAAGFGRDDADFLARHGFNTVRLGVIYKALEPQPGKYDDAYRERIFRTARMLGRRGIFPQIDFHQDMYNERFQGEGFPDWAVQDDGLPAEPKRGFPQNYLFMAALWRAYDHFWANDPGPGGVGLQDRYAAAWRHVAKRFRSKPWLLGYDLFNEPWPGSVWTTCANPVGCPLFDGGPLTSFSKKMISSVREVNGRKLIWYEPNVIFNSGADTHHGDTGDDSTGMSFHIYCLPEAFSIPGLPPEACDALERLVLTNAEEQTDRTGDALLISEFGATDNLETIGRIVEASDDSMVSWQYWHYCACDDPTTAGPGVQALVIDANKPPTGDNVKDAKLGVLKRPYPQVVAGTPTGYGFDVDTKRFQLSYSTSRAGGGSFSRRYGTVVFVPRRHYPNGYAVEVDGATVTSGPDAKLLRLVAKPGATAVKLTITPK